MSPISARIVNASSGPMPGSCCNVIAIGSPSVAWRTAASARAASVRTTERSWRSGGQLAAGGGGRKGGTAGGGGGGQGIRGEPRIIRRLREPTRIAQALPQEHGAQAINKRRPYLDERSPAATQLAQLPDRHRRGVNAD